MKFDLYQNSEFLIPESKDFVENIHVFLSETWLRNIFYYCLKRPKYGIASKNHIVF